MGDKGEYSENVPSDLEFLGGGFTVLQANSLAQTDVGDGPGLRVLKEVLLTIMRCSGSVFSVQPQEEYTRVREKTGDKWRDVMRFPAMRHREFSEEVSRLFLRSKFSDYRLPQDGVVLLALGDGSWYDLFVSTVSGIHGPIFDFTFSRRETSFDLDLDKLGFDAAGLSALKKAVDAPAGMVLVTGPTHSGKSIVCYSAVMRRLRRGDSATAIEAPRKFRLPGARQIQLDYGANYENFYTNALADNPRVLLVQEIRYYEPIVGALAIAGERLVVAGIHAAEVLPCLLRLRYIAGLKNDLNSDKKLIREYLELLTENLSLICSGRVLRLLCPCCRQPGSILAATIRRSGLAMAVEGDVPVFIQGPGCEACRGTGITGFRGIYEVLPISRAMRRLLSGPAPDCAIIRQAREEGLLNLREMALRLALDGAISFKHAMAATPPPFPDSLNN